MNVFTLPPEVGQVQEELDQARSLYIDRAPKTVLEIGCYYGGTLFEWLTCGEPEKVVAVDPNHRSKDLYEGWTREGTELIVVENITEASQDVIREHGPYDWVFIDGDHSEAGVRLDVATTKPLISKGGLMLIHDVSWGGPAQSQTLPMRQVYSELVKDHLGWIIHAEPEAIYPENCAHGIGVLCF